MPIVAESTGDVLDLDDARLPGAVIDGDHQTSLRDAVLQQLLTD